MSVPSGYVDSQTWQAWYDALLIVCANTSVLFLSLLGVAAAAVAYVASLPEDGKAAGDDNTDRARRRALSILDEAEEEREEEADCVLRRRAVSTEAGHGQTGTGGSQHGQTGAGESEDVRTCSKEPRRAEAAKAFALSREDAAKERLVTQEQLGHIFGVMTQHKDKFGETSLGELEEQLRLYASQ